MIPFSPPNPNVMRKTSAIVFALTCCMGMILNFIGHAADPVIPRVESTFGPKLAGSAVYPKQNIPLRFDHSKHLAKGITCKQCHRSIESSNHVTDFNFPPAASCDACHGQMHPRPKDDVAPGKCSMCHTQVVNETRVTASVEAPPARLHFSHRDHLQRGAKCEDCHGDMRRVNFATEMQLPREKTCLKCHDGKKARDQCGVCHLSRSGGVLQTRPFGDREAVPLMPRGTQSRGMAHDLAFVRDHRAIAKANPQACAVCHEQDFCFDCHNGVIRPFRIHAGDYIRQHAIDAQTRANSCKSCHSMQKDCRVCHVRVGLNSTGPESKFGVGSSLRFHPPNWASSAGGSQGHIHAARHNLQSCVSCHDEDSCLACHATTSVGNPGFSASPHGQNFSTSARCDMLASRNRRVCLKCHAPGDPHLYCR